MDGQCADARHGSLPDPAQLPAASGARRRVRLHHHDGDDRHRHRLVAGARAAHACGVPVATRAGVRAGGTDAGAEGRAADLRGDPAQRTAARDRLREHRDGGGDPARKRARLPQALRSQCRILGQPDRPRSRRPARAVVCLGDPGRRHPGHGAGRVAGRPGPERCAEPEAQGTMSELLALKALSVRLPPNADRTHALKDVSLSLKGNEILCVVGESGSGKSMTASAIMQLLPGNVTIDAGEVLFEGRNLCDASDAEMRKVRGAKIAMIFQEPMTSLNPLITIGAQIGEMFRIHTELSADAIEARVLALLEEVRIPDPARAYAAYPHELSGGQRQRAMIAMALALDPAVLIADEPTTALDVTTQAQILALIRDLQKRKGTAVLFITHDFGVVAEIADRVAVMQHGLVVEEGTAQEVLKAPKHAYTRQLIAAVPPLKSPPPRALSDEMILEIEGVSKTYVSGGFLGRNARVTKAVDNVTLALPKGATIGIVGESGSGKSTLARCLVRLNDPDSGAIRLNGRDLLPLSADEMRAERRRIQMVFQDPFASLNPRRRAGDLVAQGMVLHLSLIHI